MKIVSGRRRGAAAPSRAPRRARRGALLGARLGAALALAALASQAQASETGLVAGVASLGPGAARVVLTGPWETFAGAFTDAELNAHPRSPGFSIATLEPSIFRRPASEEGSVTYRARIRLVGRAAPDRGPPRMAVFFPNLGAFESLEADGNLIFERARGDSPLAALAFQPRGSEFSIVLRSGPGDRRLDSPSLFPAFCVVGDEASIVAAQLAVVSVATLLPILSLLTAVLLFSFYLMWRKDREFLAFALFMATLAAFYAAKHQPYLGFAGLRLGPGLMEELYIAAMSLQYAALASFLGSMFLDILPRWLRAVMHTLPLLPAAAAVAFPGHLAPAYGAAVAYGSLFGIAAIVFLGFRLAKGDRRARWLFPAFLVASAAIGAGLALRESLAGAYLAEPVGMFAFAMLCTLMIVKKAGSAFESAEALTDYVDTVAKTVKSFIPREFLDNLQKKDVTDLRLGDHAKKDMTIFISDIRSFTELSETLTVEENFAFINSYLSQMVPIVNANGGFVDRYIGDAIMALFPGRDGAERAIRTEIAMQAKLAEYNEGRAKAGYRRIEMGAGIHKGDLMLGIVGVSDRMESAVISDVVSIALRLQAITKVFNISLAISEQAFKSLEDPGSHKYRFIGKVKVKGKAAPLSIFEIFDGIDPGLFERKMRANMFFEQGMLSYFQKDFAGAMYYFKRVLDIMPEDGAAGFYLDNCMKRVSG